MKVCPKCARSFAEGFHFCPQDATELVKYDLRVRLNRQSELQFLLPSESLLVRLRRELTAAANEFKHNPRNFLAGLLRGEGNSRRRKRLLQAGVASAVIVYGGIMMAGLLIGLLTSSHHLSEASKPEQRTISHDPVFVVPLLTARPERTNNSSKTDQGALGGSLQRRQKSGGGGGANDSQPARSGVPTQAMLNVQLRPPDLDPAKLNATLITPMTVVADPNAFLKLKGRIGDWRGQGDAPSLGNKGGNGIGDGLGDGYSKGRDFNVGGNDPRLTGGKPTGTGDEVFGQTRNLRPTILYKERAKYTEEARQNKIQGTVVLSLIFGADGRIRDIRTVRSLPFGLTESAIEAAQKIRFSPAMRDGRPVNVRTQIEYNFTLY